MSDAIQCPRCQGFGYDPMSYDVDSRGNVVADACNLCEGLEVIPRDTALDYVLAIG